MTPSPIRPRRSVLYMPASNAKAVEKARSLPCDAVILDLEDAVAPETKDAARAMAVEAVATGGFGRRELVIRVNGLDTPWGEEDLAAAIRTRPDAILVPKVNTASDVMSYQHRVGQAGIDLWVMVETARALFDLYGIAASKSETNLKCLVMGTNDLAKETGARLVSGREPLIGALGLVVAAAKCQGLCVLDGVYNDLEDIEGFSSECTQGRNFGFDGKTLIHPKQIEACNVVFSPSEEEIASARAIVLAFGADENAGRGVVRINGKMVERLHLAQSERILAVAAAVGASVTPTTGT